MLALICSQFLTLIWLHFSILFYSQFPIFLPFHDGRQQNFLMLHIFALTHLQVLRYKFDSHKHVGFLTISERFWGTRNPLTVNHTNFPDFISFDQHPVMEIFAEMNVLTFLLYYSLSVWKWVTLKLLSQASLLN